MDLISALAGITKNGAASNIVFVGSVSAGYNGTTGTRTLDLTSLTGGIDTAPSEDDLVFVCAGSAGGSQPALSFVTSGYTTIYAAFQNDTRDTRILTGYKFMSATPDTSLVMSGSGSNTTSSTYIAMVFRNVDQTSPVNFLQTLPQANTCIPTPPAITPSGGNFLIVCAATGAQGGSIQTYSSSQLSNFVSVGSNDDDADSVAGVGTYAWVEGTFTPSQWTFSGTDQTSNSNISMTIALKST